MDTRPYEAALTQYEGQREKDQALLDNSRRDLKRYKTLINQDATSQQTVDTAEATVRQYERTVRADQGQVDAQKLNLTYCRIVSPIDGRVGLRQVMQRLGTGVRLGVEGLRPNQYRKACPRGARNRRQPDRPRHRYG